MGHCRNRFWADRRYAEIMGVTIQTWIEVFLQRAFSKPSIKMIALVSSNASIDRPPFETAYRVEREDAFILVKD